VDEREVGFNDARCGEQRQHLAREVGDFVVRRADGLFAYQLAVVVDDAFQGVSHVVRGADLLGNTPRQIFLQRCLGLPTPAYTHLPLVRNALGQKLSKQSGAQALPDTRPDAALRAALAVLGLHAPQALQTCQSLLDWGLANWRDPGGDALHRNGADCGMA
jgi:glutamyl-Q tRNA(Asp) synthetase